MLFLCHIDKQYSRQVVKIQPSHAYRVAKPNLSWAIQEWHRKWVLM